MRTTTQALRHTSCIRQEVNEIEPWENKNEPSPSLWSGSRSFPRSPSPTDGFRVQIDSLNLASEGRKVEGKALWIDLRCRNKFTNLLCTRDNRKNLCRLDLE
uniref:Uncharacterized protein n=1 Tax=Picea glauca TaxID=3330 RepID=A0A117NGK0_PICGL|nr:hypothetical protein ABT39_MTgene6382 [Picea glauca]QHR86290.1 hypothetical protein Q903MT_gene289 [Picea sitchensis]